MILSHNVVSSLTSERDQYRRDFCAMSDRCTALAAQLTEMERDRDAVRLELVAARRLQLQYETENLRLRDEHATAVFSVQELTAALRDMTARALGEELNKR